MNASARAVFLRRLAARREADARRSEADAAALRKLADELDGYAVPSPVNDLELAAVAKLAREKGLEFGR